MNVYEFIDENYEKAVKLKSTTSFWILVGLEFWPYFSYMNRKEIMVFTGEYSTSTDHTYKCIKLGMSLHKLKISLHGNPT